MAKVTPELLAECLDDIQAGRSSIEECLSAHPAAAEELRGLLEVAHAIAPPPPADPDPAFRLRARVALVEAISAQTDRAATSPLRRLWARVVGGWHPAPRLAPQAMRVPTLGVALAIALATAAWAGTVSAAQNALPGDALYQVKTAVEDLGLALAASDEVRAQAHLELASRRLAEVQRASDSGRAAEASAAAEAFTQEVARADQHLVQAAAAGRDVSKLAARLAADLASQQATLAVVQARAPEQARDALARASRAAGRGLALAGGRSQKVPAADERPGSGGAESPSEVVAEDQATGATESGRGDAAATPEPTATLTGTTTAPSDQTVPNAEGVTPAGKPRGGSDLSDETRRSLLAKLEAVEAAADRGSRDAALQILDAYLAELDALRRSGRIGAEEYDALYARYSSLLTSLGEKPKARATPEPVGPTRPKPQPTRPASPPGQTPPGPGGDGGTTPGRPPR